MHRTRFFFGVLVLVLAAGIVVIAQQGPGNSSKPTKTSPKVAAPAPHATTKPTAPVSQPKMNTQPKTATKVAPTSKGAASTKAASTTKGGAATTQAKSSPAKTTKTDKTTTTAKATEKPLKSQKPTDTKLAKADKPAKSTKTTTVGTSTGTTTELTAVQQKLKQNTNLAAKVASRLPPGTDLMTAAAGFRNLGQFIAAANVSNNLGLSFTELKTKMVTDGMSLGQAIQAVRPLTASPTIEAQRAEYDARGMIAESEQPTSGTSSTATTSARGSSSPTTTATSTTAPSTTATTSTTAKPKAKAKKPGQ